MHYSPPFKASPHCSASPDGRWVATALTSGIVVRSTESLQTVNAVTLPSGLSGPILTLLWSPSSTKILVSTADQIHVLGAFDVSFHAAVQNPVSGTARPSHICFGSNDTEVLVFASFGLKLMIYNIESSKASEITSPKFHLPSAAARGISFRPETGHLALLTRVAGTDIVSTHGLYSHQLQRSWKSETYDAQALRWSPDGQWLLLNDSSAHGWRLLVYTPDGQLVRNLEAANGKNEDNAALKPGIKFCQFSPDSAALAVGDHSRTVVLLNTRTWRKSLGLMHPSTISPSETLQVWQEQMQGSVASENPARTFHRATQQISPPGPSSDASSSTELKLGCSSLCFDASSSLLATRLDDSPSTLWIWDLVSAELRAVLLFHSPVEFGWHPRIRELLLVTCLDEDNRNVPFIWDPLSEGPKHVPVGAAFPGGKVIGKTQASWVNWDAEDAALLLADSQHCCLASMADPDAPPEQWSSENVSQLWQGSGGTNQGSLRYGGSHPADDDTSVLDDTFSFKHG